MLFKVSEEKKTFIVRQNCEYSIEVAADDEEEAISMANAQATEDWCQSWSSLEAEEE